jgi:DHA3 family tetracycline resistance protein-like MFS transporter
MPVIKHERRALVIYIAMTGSDWLIFSLYSTVVFVYRATYITDDPFQLSLIWTAFTVTALLFEIPTGVVADVYSRRLSIIIGFLLIGVAAVIEGIFPVFELVVLAQVIWGIGFTFTSGARDAWVADEMGEEGASRAFIRSTQVAQVVQLAGIPVGTALGTLALNYPIILSGILYLLLAVSLVLVMPEEGFQRRPAAERQSWRAMFSTFGEGVRLVRGSTVLLAILGVSAVYGISSSGFDNLWTVNVLENVPFPGVVDWEPVVWFGVLNAIVAVLGLVGTEIVQRRLDVRHQSAIARTLVALTTVTALCMVIFGLTRNFWLAASTYCLSITLRTIADPVLRTWINQNVESVVRATVLSMDSQLFSLGEMVGAPALGAIGTAVSLPASLTISGLVRLPIALIFARVGRGPRGGSEGPGEEEGSGSPAGQTLI